MGDIADYYIENFDFFEEENMGKTFVQLRFFNNLDVGQTVKAIFIDLSNKDKREIGRARQFFPTAIARFAKEQPENACDVEVEKWWVQKNPPLDDYIIAEWDE